MEALIAMKRGWKIGGLIILIVGLVAALAPSVIAQKPKLFTCPAPKSVQIHTVPTRDPNAPWRMARRGVSKPDQVTMRMGPNNLTIECRYLQRGRYLFTLDTKIPANTICNKVSKSVTSCAANLKKIRPTN